MRVATLLKLLLSTMVLLVTVTGCTSFGPRTVIKDRVDYSETIADSWMRLILLNIVKMRYLSPPVYVDVSSVTTGNSLESTANVGFSWTSLSNTVDTLSTGIAEKYTDRPTITYTPLTTSKFVKSLLTPIPPQDLFFILQSGWSADAMFYGGVSAINGLRNNEPSLAGELEGDEGFFQFLQVINKLQSAGAINLQISRICGKRGDVCNEDEKETATFLTVQSDQAGLPEPVRTDLLRFKTLLGLKKDSNSFRLVYGSHRDNDSQITVQTRSLVQILNVMAAEMEVPPEHAAELRTTKSPTHTRPKLMPIRCSQSAPGSALVSVRYRDHWFYIDDRDLEAKRALNFIMILFSLAETGDLRLPLVTIPAQ